MRSLFLVLIGGLLLFPRPAAACTCYSPQAGEVQVDPTPYCVTACDTDMTATAIGQGDCEFGEEECTFEPGYCRCSSSVETFSCEDVCADEGYDSEPPAPASTAAPSAPSSRAPSPLITPTLSVDIPTVSFTQATQKDGVLTINYLGDYIAGLYQWMIGMGTLVAIVAIMVGGLLYALSKEAEGKKIMKNAVTGLVLLLSTYLILYTVNPRLTIFKPLELTVIPEIEEEEDDVVSGSLATSFKAPTGGGIAGPGKSQVPEDITQYLEAAAETLESEGYGMYITSSFRSTDEQIALIRRNCKNPPGSATCDPKPGRPITCILKDNNPANCPHTTGRALDIWATRNGQVCVTQSQCSKDPNKDACRKNACQGALIDAMESAGFCNLSTEAWHFEKPKMSSKCN